MVNIDKLYHTWGSFGQGFFYHTKIVVHHFESNSVFHSLGLAKNGAPFGWTIAGLSRIATKGRSAGRVSFRLVKDVLVCPEGCLFLRFSDAKSNDESLSSFPQQHHIHAYNI